MNKFKELVVKLREILQIDRPELDFGIYRIINARATEIEKFLTEILPGKVKTALSSGNSGDLAAKQQDLQKLAANLQDAGVNPANSPKYVALQDEIAQLQSGGVDYEGRVYAHLLNFFGRYYDKGDFISKRRYKGDAYAIPYSGEEVLLYWANFDQYYTKSGENFTNYTIKLDDKSKVHFRLTAADTAKDNRKDNELERCFVLAQARTEIRVNSDNEEVEEAIVPVQSFGDELVIRFEYKPMPKGTKQAELVQQAVKSVLANPEVLNRWGELAESCPTEKNKERTRLEKELSDYVAKNKADYFIHKDLGKFLRRELDFYIKNEMLHLDDIQHIDAFREIEKNLKMIQCMRAIAEELITFMAQLEDFQKKLWLKKKFVTQCDYCITLDKVPEKFYPEILRNLAQWTEWEKLGFVEVKCNGKVPFKYAKEPIKNIEVKFPELKYPDWICFEDKNELLIMDNHGMKEWKPGTSRIVSRRLTEKEFFSLHSHLMVDTKFFEEDFKAKLLAEIPDIDAKIDGLLIHGENFQALNLLQERYREQVKCIYIDPPYNTGGDGFIYRDNYQHSSWLSMTIDRIKTALKLMHIQGVFFTSIDENEINVYSIVCKEIFPYSLGIIAVKNNPKGRIFDKYFSTSHEYLLSFSISELGGMLVHTKTDEEIRKDYPLIDERGRHRLLELRNTHREFGKFNRPKLFYPLYVQSDNSVTLTPTPDSTIVLPLWDDGFEGCWTWGGELAKREASKLIAKEINGKIKIYRKAYAKDDDGNDAVKQVKTVWDDKKYQTDKGQITLTNLFGDRLFASPKPPDYILDIVKLISFDNSCTVLDYFAGSGTTGHAVINLNREDGGKRKYILVEMGDHFENVLKPRIQKVVFAKDWKDGKPVMESRGKLKQQIHHRETVERDNEGDELTLDFDIGLDKQTLVKNEDFHSDNIYNGISHCFKYMRLESYEDTLNNLRLSMSDAQQNLLNLNDNLKTEYLLEYMLEQESRRSLLSTDDFKKPFDYMLNIAADSAGATRPTRIDLVETFNYLLGLRVKHQQYWPERGICIVEGTLPGGENTIILWRDCEKVGYEELNKFCDSMGINPRESIYDCVYVNGDNAIPNQTQSLESEGGITKVLKLRQTEEEFLSRMFEV